MKNSILIFATFITLIACSKDDNSTNPNPTNTNGISVKINGVLWEGSTVSNMVDESTLIISLAWVHILQAMIILLTQIFYEQTKLFFQIRKQVKLQLT